MRFGPCSKAAIGARRIKNEQSQLCPFAVDCWSKLAQSQRWHHVGSRNRCSAFWVPSNRVGGKGIAKEDEGNSNALLVGAGFIRQAYAGIFHLLPLGLRVQQKIERLLERHMRGLQASQITLSSLSSQKLWSQSGRLDTTPHVFKLVDRKDTKWLLAPTHEEEITKLVGSMVQSYRDLPLRLYQISRKYRDEPRPRQGLLRGREFLMKDLYTFDVDEPGALQTYGQVREAYNRFFDELKMPYIVAEADSGNMGGDLSHEYHLPSSKGEDTIIRCSRCNYVKNEEVVKTIPLEVRPLPSIEQSDDQPMKEIIPLREANFLTQDKKTLVKAFCRFSNRTSQGDDLECSINPHVVKGAIPDIALGIENPVAQFHAGRAKDASLLYIFDDQVERSDIHAKLAMEQVFINESGFPVYVGEGTPGSLCVPGLVKLRTDDQCPVCLEGRLVVQKAIEIGHTFHLGTRYTEALGVRVAVDPSSTSQTESLVQMGCHGIGVSRLIAAAASALSDTRGLNWPRVLAPFEVVIIPHQSQDTQACDTVYDSLVQDQSACNDAIIDNREMDWLSKLRHADLVGYPIIVFLGKAWRQRGDYEVQCRRLKVKQDIPAADLSGFVKGLLEQL